MFSEVPCDSYNPALTVFQTYFEPIKTFLELLALDKLFSNTFFFQIISKTVRHIDKKYGIKCVGLLI